MELTVIVPDDRPGMQRMLANELKFIEKVEVIYDEWRSGLKKAQGDFVLLLEYDSALERGSIARLIAPFQENPNYRKLVMVSPMIEFEDSNPTNLTGATNQQDYFTARFGSLAGSVIRRSSLLKYLDAAKGDMIDSSYNLSLAFWEHGLRIMSDPQSLYYSPTRWTSYKPKTWKVSPELSRMWIQECIA